MKSYALILLAIISLSQASSSPIEVVKCLIKSEQLQKDVSKVVSAILSKDYMKILQTVIEVFPTVYSEVTKCLNQEIQLFSTMRTLENKKPSECVSKCFRGCQHLKKYFEYRVCADDCIEKTCKELK